MNCGTTISMTTYKKLESVKKFRAFDNWSHKKSKSSANFGIQTLVFGANGTGKSTTSALFRRVQLIQEKKSTNLDCMSNVKYELQHSSGSAIVDGFSSELPRTLVFNSEFVEANLDLAFDKGNGKPLYILGEPSLDLEQRVAETKNCLETVYASRSTDIDKLEKFREKQNQLVSDTKAEVIAQLGSYDPATYNQSTFNTRKARQLLQSQQLSSTLSPTARTKALRDLHLKLDNITEYIVCDSAPNVSELVESLKKLSTHQLISKPIPELNTETELSDWLYTGLKLHKTDRRCKLCHGRISDGRIARLYDHFSSSYTELHALTAKAEAAADSVEESLTRSTQQLADISKNNTPAMESMHSVLENARSHLNKVIRFIAASRDYISSRRIRPFTTPGRCPTYDNSLEDNWITLQRSINNRNEKNSQQRRDIDRIRSRAKDRLLSHIAAVKVPLFVEATQMVHKAEQALRATERRIEDLEAKLQELLTQRMNTNDGKTLALRLTMDLEHYLGHKQLSVSYESDDDSIGYVFRRNSQPASFLSDGEKSALALLYFLRSLESLDNQDRLKDTCVVIDDPVSSLDHDSIISAVSFIQNALKTTDGKLKCRQYVLFTHNFTFFRHWKDVLQGPLNKDRRDRTDAKKQPKTPRAAVLEMRMRTESMGAKTIRTPVFRSFGTKLDLISSEYYYLFGQACDALTPEGEALLPLTGNSTRRLLESFLRFKRPDLPHLMNAAKELGIALKVDNSVVESVVKTLHSSSHRTEIDMHSPTFRGSIVREIRATLLFMKAVDRQHYDGMCKAIDVAPALH